jgi:hypothetical protein
MNHRYHHQWVLPMLNLLLMNPSIGMNGRLVTLEFDLCLCKNDNPIWCDPQNQQLNMELEKHLVEIKKVDIDIKEGQASHSISLPF